MGCANWVIGKSGDRGTEKSENLKSISFCEWPKEADDPDSAQSSVVLRAVLISDLPITRLPDYFGLSRCTVFAA